MPDSRLAPAVFIDRDGVIIHNREHYVRAWRHVKIYPRAIQALANFAASPYRVVIVTNQAGVGKGLYSLETVAEINARLVEIIQAAGGRVDGVYVCPHTPADGCACRKPQPGLLLQAARDQGLDLPRSVMIGDALSDLQAGQRAGVGRCVLVRTGRGNRQLNLAVETPGLPPFQVRRSLTEALAGLT
jgi:histidinol-phosphate phosphatase family protein